VVRIALQQQPWPSRPSKIWVAPQRIT
jgi:hypothetical protein